MIKADFDEYVVIDIELQTEKATDGQSAAGAAQRQHWQMNSRKSLMTSATRSQNRLMDMIVPTFAAAVHAIETVYAFLESRGCTHYHSL